MNNGRNVVVNVMHEMQMLRALRYYLAHPLNFAKKKPPKANLPVIMS